MGILVGVGDIQAAQGALRKHPQAQPPPGPFPVCRLSPAPCSSPPPGLSLAFFLPLLRSLAPSPCVFPSLFCPPVPRSLPFLQVSLSLPLSPSLLGLVSCSSSAPQAPRHCSSGPQALSTPHANTARELPGHWLCPGLPARLKVNPQGLMAPGTSPLQDAGGGRCLLTASGGLFYFGGLDMEPSALCILSTCSATEPCPL